MVNSIVFPILADSTFTTLHTGADQSKITLVPRNEKEQISQSLHFFFSMQEGRIKIPNELGNKSTIIKKVAFGVVTSVEIQPNRTLLLSLLVQ